MFLHILYGKYLDVPILINIGIIFFREKAYSKFQNFQISSSLGKCPYFAYILLQTKYSQRLE